MSKTSSPSLILTVLRVLVVAMTLMISSANLVPAFAAPTDQSSPATIQKVPPAEEPTKDPELLQQIISTTSSFTNITDEELSSNSSYDLCAKAENLGAEMTPEMLTTCTEEPEILLTLKIDRLTTEKEETKKELIDFLKSVGVENVGAETIEKKFKTEDELKDWWDKKLKIFWDNNRPVDCVSLTIKRKGKDEVSAKIVERDTGEFTLSGPKSPPTKKIERKQKTPDLKVIP